MNKRTISATWMVVLLLSFTGVVNIVVLRVPNFSVLKVALGFFWLFVVSGWLISRLINLRTSARIEKFIYQIGFGLLAVMVWGLALNTVLPLFGDSHPFAMPGLLLGFDIGWIALLTLTMLRTGRSQFEISVPSFDTRDIITVLSGLSLIGLTALGAISLNNNGTGDFTWAMLVLAAVYLAVLVGLRDYLSEGAIMAGLFLVALSTLLMTSLRGWYITGHDVQLEYYVFSLTLGHLRWNIASFQDAYNACLSITILPTIIRQIMGVGELYVYKTVFQILFALVPVEVYLIARRFNSRLVALLASIYFVAFPTFFSDMPFLNRQEIAFLFMGLIFLTAFNYSWSLLRRRLLIFFLGVGVVISHYTTAYFMLSLFGLVVLLRYVGTWWRRRSLSSHRTATKSDWRGLRQTGPISVILVLTLVAGTYIWSVSLTNTGGNLASVITQTFQSLVSGMPGSSKSSDTGYSLFGGAKLTAQQQLDNYAETSVATIRAAIPHGQTYPIASYDHEPLRVAPLANMSLTIPGRILNVVFPVTKFNSALRGGSALFLQLALIVGVAMLFIIRPMRRRLESDWRLFQLAAIIFIGAVVALPVLSAQYGVLRAFQQVLMICAASIVLVTIAVIPKRFRRARTFVPSTLAIGFFVSSTGIITASLGGYPAQLQMANAGSYYDLYYTHDPEAQATDWLGNTISRSGQLSPVSTSVVADGYLFDRINQLPESIVSADGIYPGVLRRNGYVFLGYTATVMHEAVIYDNGNLITYQYPTGFLNATKDLIYTNSESEVYR